MLAFPVAPLAVSAAASRRGNTRRSTDAPRPHSNCFPKHLPTANALLTPSSWKPCPQYAPQKYVRFLPLIAIFMIDFFRANGPFNISENTSSRKVEWKAMGLPSTRANPSVLSREPGRLDRVVIHHPRGPVCPRRVWRLLGFGSRRPAALATQRGRGENDAWHLPRNLGWERRPSMCGSRFLASCVVATFLAGNAGLGFAEQPAPAPRPAALTRFPDRFNGISGVARRIRRYRHLLRPPERVPLRRRLPPLVGPAVSQ